MIVSRGIGRGPYAGNLVAYGLGIRTPIAIDCKYCRHVGISVFLAPLSLVVGGSDKTVTVVRYGK